MAAACLVAGFVTARCERPPVVSVFPPLDPCCQCLATHSTARGARCSRGSVTDCLHDLENLDFPGSETNLRCIRTICGQQCTFLAQLLPSESVTRKCCACLADNQQEGTDCYNGTTEECITELEEGEPNRILQGAGICLASVCKSACEPLFGPLGEDAGQPDSGGFLSLDGGGGGMDANGPFRRDAGIRDGGPFLPFDGGCPGRFPCF